jgi:hypothetical protein
MFEKAIISCDYVPQDVCFVHIYVSPSVIGISVSVTRFSPLRTVDLVTTTSCGKRNVKSTRYSGLSNLPVRWRKPKDSSYLANLIREPLLIRA